MLFNGQFLNGVDCFRIFNYFEKYYPEFFASDYFVKVQQMFSNTGIDPPADNPSYAGSFPPFNGVKDVSSRVWFRFEFQVFKYTKHETVNGQGEVTDVTYSWDLHARKFVYYSRLFGVKNTKNWSINTGDLPM